MTTATAEERASAPPQAFAKMVVNETRLAWRSPRGLVIGIGLPIALLVLFHSLPHFKGRPASLGGLTLFDAEVPVLAAFVIAALALLVLPAPLATYRERGILRRLSTTPAAPGWLLAAQLAVCTVLALIALILLFVLGVIAFGVAAPRDPGALVLSLALCACALFALGLLIAAIAPTTGSVAVFEAASFFPLIFFAGLWVPIQQMPSSLQNIAHYLPLGAAVQAAQDAMQGSFPPARPLLVMAGWGIVLALAAWRFFRWE